MPYVTQAVRDILDRDIDELLTKAVTNGNRAYIIYRIATGSWSKCYSTLSIARALVRDVLDILDEEYLAYEKKKREENGDII